MAEDLDTETDNGDEEEPDEVDLDDLPEDEDLLEEDDDALDEDEDEQDDDDEGGGVAVAEGTDETTASRARGRTAKRAGRPGEDEDEEEDDEEEDEEDVEASLDVILKERLVVEEDEEEDEEAPETDDRADSSTKVLPKQPNEFVCRSCFLVKHPSQLADAERMLCRDCV